MELKTVKSFKYLGSMISSDGQLDMEISAMISKASQALGRLNSRVLIHHNVSLTTKLKGYRAFVLTSLLYGCESWTIYCPHIRQLEKFHVEALHSIQGIWWQDKPPILKSWTKPNQPPLKWCHWKPSCHGLATSSGWVRVYTKAAILWWTSTRAKKRRLGMKVLQRHTEEQPEVMWQQAFWTQHSSPVLLLLVCTHMHSKCNPGKIVTSRTACSPNHHQIAASAPATAMAFQYPTCLKLSKSRLGLQSHSRVHWQEHRPSHPWIQGTTTIFRVGLFWHTIAI